MTLLPPRCLLVPLQARVPALPRLSLLLVSSDVMCALRHVLFSHFTRVNVVLNMVCLQHNCWNTRYTAPAPTPAPAAPAVRPSDQPIKYQYYQSPASLSISVLAKNLTAEDVVVDIQPEHLRVVVLHSAGSGPE